MFEKKKHKTGVVIIKIITQQSRTLENPNIFGIKSEHLKISHKLSKAIRQAEKVSKAGDGKNIIYWDQKKLFLDEKYAKITK